MAAPPAYKDSMAFPTVPPTDQGGYNGSSPSYTPYPASGSAQYPSSGPAQYPPYPVSGSAPYPASGSAQYPAYPVPPSEPQPAYPPYGAASTKPAYNQTPYEVGGTPYQSNTTVVVGGGYGGTNPYDGEQGTLDDTSAMWTSNSFSDKKIRQQFIKKVYLILMSQLFFTFGVVCLFFFCTPVKHWVVRNQWFYWCSYAIFVVTYITLVCCDNVRRRWPANIICLFIFTAALSYMAGTITSSYDTQSVLIALGMTAAVCLGISIFAVQTKIDFTLCSGIIFALCLVLTLFGFACIITYVVSGPNYILQCVYGGLAAVVFSLFLVFDTQMVIGGKKRRYQLSPEEHIYGALQLYVDVVNLFIILLGLVGRK